jgi:hypothetical protein
MHASAFLAAALPGCSYELMQADLNLARGPQGLPTLKTTGMHT